MNIKPTAIIRPLNWSFAGPVQDLQILLDRILHKYEKKLMRIIRRHERRNNFSLTTDIILYEKKKNE